MSTDSILPSDWARYVYTIDVASDKLVDSVDFGIMADNATGTLNFTDLQFQGGKQVSGHHPHTNEFFEPVHFDIDEYTFLHTVPNPIKHGAQPRFHSQVTNRLYNLVYRGHAYVSVPNVFHQDYFFPIVTTYLDLDIIPKNDYDLLRITTMDGHFEPRRIYGWRYSEANFPSLFHHPLHTRYTREFWFGSGRAGDAIELKTSIKAARINGRDVSRRSGRVVVDGETVRIGNQVFPLAVPGSIRLGVEFYTLVTERMHNEDVTYYKDTGVGYNILAEFRQFTPEGACRF